MTAGSRLLVGAAAAALFLALVPAVASAQRVAIVAAETPRYMLDVRAQLIRAGLTDVTTIDASIEPTPTLDNLKQYDAVFTWSDYGYADPDGLGNVLADYVDQGGGVVQAAFAFYTTLGGRWTADAYAPFTRAGYQTQAGLTLVPTMAHPILNGVASVEGGWFGFHHAGVRPQGCGVIVANWSNGQPLAAIRRGPAGGWIAGLNMFPPSSGVNANYWPTSTDGHILMANAVRFVANTPSEPPVNDGPSVALVAADETSDLEGMKCQLQDLNLFSGLSVIDARTTTPTASALSSYDAVLTWADVPYGDSASLGNVLADYVDAGGGVVQAAYRLYSAAGGRLDGRWVDGAYRPFTEAPVTTAVGLGLVVNVPGHVMFTGVPSFTAGAGSYHHSPTALDAATRMLGSWSDGQPMIAIGSDPLRRVVGLNAAPPSTDARLVANTLLVAANHWPTAHAGSDATVEATAPAGASFALSAIASDADGDALSYIWSGAVSATGASITVDVPPPAAPAKTQSHTVVLTVEDGKGGEATDSVTLTVTDTTSPVLNGVPTGIVSAQATSAAGADVSFGPITAVDAVDGATPVVCSPPAGVFPIGDTLVTCSSTDSRDNATSASFTVRVTEPPLSGDMEGKGVIHDRGALHQFSFHVRKTAAGMHEGALDLKVKGAGEFTALSADFVMFSGSSVLFRGTGSWNGVPGFACQVYAVDSGSQGSEDDFIRITANAPEGGVVDIQGVLNGNMIRANR